MPDPKLTDTRRRALAVLAAACDAGSTVRRSTVTTQPGVKHPAVHWQVADWLVAEGLAEEYGIGVVRLTPAGRVLAGKTAAQAQARR